MSRREKVKDQKSEGGGMNKGVRRSYGKEQERMTGKRSKTGCEKEMKIRKA
jgi:hypothetical protein